MSCSLTAWRCGRRWWRNCWRKRAIPEAALRTCPGYRSADGTEPVARARRVERRPREPRAEWLSFPEAMLRICPGYRLRTP
ncbi:hypothetical protein FMK68_09105 [Klebsiella grimontii]|nr:hypothetical protein [Klebsiella grimontii]